MRRYIWALALVCGPLAGYGAVQAVVAVRSLAADVAVVHRIRTQYPTLVDDLAFLAALRQQVAQRQAAQRPPVRPTPPAPVPPVPTGE